MIAKKTNKADLEKNRGLRIQLSLTIVLVAVLFVIQYETLNKTDNYNYNTARVEYEIELNKSVGNEKLVQPLPQNNLAEMLSIINDDYYVEYEVDNNTLGDISVVDLSNYEDEVLVNEIVIVNDRKAEFPGGNESLKSYIQNNLKYPKKAVSQDIQGSVLVRFVVNEKGKVKLPEIIGKVHPLLDNEALRIIKNMPDWNPAFINGAYAEFKVVIPVNFIIY